MQQSRRARELGIVVGSRAIAGVNAITDVAGVRVGHTTVDRGRRHPHRRHRDRARPVAHRSAPAGRIRVGNGYGKLVGSTQVVELGELETPVVLTATLSRVPGRRRAGRTCWRCPGGRRCARSTRWSGRPTTATSQRHPAPAGHRGARARRAGVGRGGLPAEGASGPGTGTVAFGWKGGHRHRLAPLPVAGSAARWACWCSRTSAASCWSTACRPPRRLGLAERRPGAAEQGRTRS